MEGYEMKGNTNSNTFIHSSVLRDACGNKNINILILIFIYLVDAKKDMNIVLVLLHPCDIISEYAWLHG